MKKATLSSLFLFMISTFLFGQAEQKEIPNPHQALFEKAYKAHPSVPRGILEGIAHTTTRFSHLDGSQAASCTGLPKAYTVFGLTKNGQGYFRNNLQLVSKLSGTPVKTMISDPEKAIMSFSRAYSSVQKELNISTTAIEEQVPVLIALSELPDDNLQQNFALNSHLYSVLSFLNNTQNQQFYNFPAYNINLESVFGEQNLEVLSASFVMIGSTGIKNTYGTQYKGTQNAKSPDYPPAIWDPAPSCNWSSRNGVSVSAVTIHTVQGSYSGCISWFKNCSANVTAHYVFRSSDGQVTQMVYESDKAWHVGSENPYTIGHEHEGYVSNSAWYTNAMYSSSADVTRDITNSGYGINPLRTYYGPASSSVDVLGGCTKIKGHQHYPNQSHTDPGINWNWEKYYKLINNNPAVTTMTATSGTFYDSGGATGNYTDDERDLTLINPSGVANINLSFSSFDLEANWDYMFIYDGSTTSYPLIGKYTGTNSPGTIVSSGNSILVEFRSDCATTNPGWAASWTSNSSPTSDSIPPTTSVNTNYNWHTADFTANFNDADSGSGIEKRYYQVINYNGTEWRANYRNGFFSDNFNSAIHSDWTISTGTWAISNGVLEQSNESLGNTNIYAKLDQTLSNRYLYHWQGLISGSGSNKRAGLHFFCDDASQTNRGNSYFMWFREDDDKVQFYKVTSNTFSLVKDIPFTINPNIWHDFKVIFDRITGKITIYVDNKLVDTWTDSSPHTNGDYISLRSGNCNYKVNNLKVYRSRYPSVTVTVGADTTNDIRYQNPNPTTPSGKVKSMVADSAGNLSSVGFKMINVDWTAPASVSTNDGTGNDIDTTYNNSQLSGNWSTSSDTHSGVAKYWYAIGDNPGDTNIVGWTDNWFKDSVTHTGLSLTSGNTYYFSIKAENGAGLVSDVDTSDGQILLIPTAMENPGANENTVNVYPNPFTDQSILIMNLSKDQVVSLAIYSQQGKRISILNGENKEKGVHKLKIDSKSLNLSKGLYFLQLTTDDQVQSKKLIVQ